MLKLKYNPCQTIKQGSGQGFISKYSAGKYPLTRCNAMVEAMRDIAAIKGSVDGNDLKRAGFTKSEIYHHGSKAVNMARHQSVKKIRRKLEPTIAATISTQNIMGQISIFLAASINNPPSIAALANSSNVLAAWEHYCQCVAAFKLHPWHPLRERCLACLALYLSKLDIGQASSARIIRTVEADLCTITLCQIH